MNPATGETDSAFRVHGAVMRLRTECPMEFVDLTDYVRGEVAVSGIRDGLVNIQTRHTTTAIVVNENEPLLLDDLAELLERWAPRDGRYLHDRLDLRTVNVEPGERANGHAHARALTLGASECLNLAGGELQLGRWQRILFVELDGGRERGVCVTILGVGSPSNGGGRLVASGPVLTAENRPPDRRQ